MRTTVQVPNGWSALERIHCYVNFSIQNTLADDAGSQHTLFYVLGSTIGAR